MEHLVTAILSQPITQFGGVIGILLALQKAGIDVKAVVRSLIGINDEVKDVGANVQTALQPLLSQMEKLTQYANHDTTFLLTEIRDGLKEGFSKIHNKHDEWDRRGIPTEDCKK